MINASNVPEKIQSLKEFAKRTSRPSSYNDRIFKAVIIAIDLVGSTELKTAKGFPTWVDFLYDFYSDVIAIVSEKRLFPVKFIGDCLLYFYPYPATDKKTKKYRQNRSDTGTFPARLTPDGILEVLIKLRRSFWNRYKEQLRSDEDKKNALQVTIALDYGKVIDIGHEMEGDPDPVGIPVDRCFRIQHISGPNQIVMSKSFMQLLNDSNREKLIRVSVGSAALKDFEKEKELYYVIPKSDEIRWILNEKNKTLLEMESKPMVHKVKIKLLEEKLKF